MSSKNCRQVNGCNIGKSIVNQCERTTLAATNKTLHHRAPRREDEPTNAGVDHHIRARAKTVDQQIAYTVPRTRSTVSDYVEDRRCKKCNGQPASLCHKYHLRKSRMN